MRYVLFGMPNVGKSSLFNKICNKNISIISDQDNTTIDYISYSIGENIIIDTNGFNSVKDFDSPVGKVILNSDVVLYVINGSIGLKTMDYEFIKYLRKNKKTIYGIINFSDKKNFMDVPGIFDKNYHTSATSNIDLDFLPLDNQNKTERANTISLIGKSNVGKSSLMNCLVNSNRSIVKDELHTTLDSVSEQYNGINYIDTAGYKKSNNYMDYIISKKRQQSLQYVHGNVIVLDYSSEITALDKQAINYGLDNNIFSIICFNKCDLPKALNHQLNVPDWIPVVETCATKNNISQLKRKIDQLFNINTNINTKDLNQLFLKHKKQLYMSDNSPCNIKYLTQTHNKPIEISYFSSKKLSEHSCKFLKRIIANRFKLYGHRIKINWKKKTNIYI